MKKVFLFVLYIVAVVCHPLLPKRYAVWYDNDFCGWAYDSPRWKVFAGIYAAIVAVMSLA